MGIMQEEKKYEEKIVVRMLCLAMAASMIGTMVPTSLYPVTAKAAEANQDMEHLIKMRIRLQFRRSWKMVSMMNGHWRIKLGMMQFVQ